MKVGRFKCSVAHPSFKHTASLDNDVFVFARSPLWLRRGAGDYRFIGPGDILMHRSGAALDRRGTATHGEHTYWFGLHPGVFVEALERHGLPTEEMGDALVADPLLRHRLTVLINQLDNDSPESFATEEKVLALLDDICALRANHLCQSYRKRIGTDERRRRLADRARAFLDAHLTESIALSDVASASGASLYHLCRVFKDETSLTMHAYVTRKRLGLAVEKIAEDRADNLADLALGLGFSSHSHFSRVFNQQVGVPPSVMIESSRLVS